MGIKRFSENNPAAVTFCFLVITLISVFCTDPMIHFLCLVGAVLYNSIAVKCRAKTHISFAILFLILSAANPLISHNGVTVLLVINDNPITLESLLYGINSSLMMISALYWLRSFSMIMTSDKLLYIFSRFSPKASLVFSMAVRYGSLLRRQWEKTENSARAMGLYKEDEIFGGLHGKMCVFSAVGTWALENGIVTADSMESRGYGTSRRTAFSRYAFGIYDVLLVILFFISGGLCTAAIILKKLDFVFYPEIITGEITFLRIVSHIVYGIISLIPALSEVISDLRWKFLK